MSHDAFCDQWEAATVEDVETLAAWLIVAEMRKEELKARHFTLVPSFFLFSDFATAATYHLI